MSVTVASLPSPLHTFIFLCTGSSPVGSVPDTKYSFLEAKPSGDGSPDKTSTSTSTTSPGFSNGRFALFPIAASITFLQIGAAPVTPDATSFMEELSLLPTHTPADKIDETINASPSEITFLLGSSRHSSSTFPSLSVTLSIATGSTFVPPFPNALYAVTRSRSRTSPPPSVTDKPTLFKSPAVGSSVFTPKSYATVSI